jgi:hypothetical protein
MFTELSGIRLATTLLEAVDEASSPPVHPRFRELMARVHHLGSDYTEVTQNDPSPLTDLRVKLDPAIAGYLALNLEVLAAGAPGLIDDITRLGAAGGDHVVHRLSGRPPDESGTGTGARLPEVVADLLPDRTHLVRELLNFYVNKLGSWEDGTSIASSSPSRRPDPRGAAAPTTGPGWTRWRAWCWACRATLAAVRCSTGRCSVGPTRSKPSSPSSARPASSSSDSTTPRPPRKP